MALCQVHHVDIVADAGSVGSVIVVSEDMDDGKLADGYLGNIGQQVVGDALGIFADQAALVSADGVEVAEQDDLPFVVALPQVGEDALLHGLGGAVGIGGLAHRAVFRDRDLGGIAVYSGGRGEDDLLAAVLAHDVAEHKGGTDVVGIVFQRLSGGFAHGLVACEVDDGVDAFLVKEVCQGCSVLYVDLIESGTLSCDGLDPVYDQGFGIIKVVGDDNVIACVQEFNNCMASDKTCTACYEDFHVFSFQILLYMLPALLCCF